MRPAGPAVDPAQFRALARQRPLRPYEGFTASERWGPRSLAAAEAVLQHGWKLGAFPAVRLVPPIAWDELCASHRSWHYHLHALEGIGLPLMAHSEVGGRHWIEHALPIALDWLRAHPSRESDSPFAWYDMAVGLRAYRLAYLADVVARDPASEDATLGRLLDGVVLHLDVLADDAGFAAHSNHGLYQAAGQLAAAIRLRGLDGVGAIEAQGRRRLDGMLASQFTGEGVHREHSPGYHYLVLDTFLRIVKAGLVGEGLEDRVRDAEATLAWFIRPDGRLVALGDTTERVIRGAPFATARSSELRFMATAGAEGEPPAGRLRAFPETGYVIMRERWPRGTADFGEGGHVAQACGFHSPTHKHADDLSFTWYERGAEILVDAGRFGYVGRMPAGSPLRRRGFWYSDPRRVYVESTRAHNTVEVDRMSHDRTAKPYGSALRGWGEAGDVMWSRCSAAFGSVRHERLLAYHPGRWLLVVDDLEDPGGAEHHFAQHWHVAPEHAVRLDDRRVEIWLAGRPADAVHAVPLLPCRSAGLASGEREPELYGWVSRRANELEPAPAFAYEIDAAPAARFATVFSFAATPPRPAPAEVGAYRWAEGTAEWCVTATAEGLEVTRR